MITIHEIKSKCVNSVCKILHMTCEKQLHHNRKNKAANVFRTPWVYQHGISTADLECNICRSHSQIPAGRPAPEGGVPCPLRAGAGE